MRAAAACALAAVALAAGCGGDDEEEPPEREATAPATTGGPPTEESPPPEAGTETGGGAPTPPPPEPDAEDPDAEEPVRAEAVFTGRGGRITPARVHVPPYIAVRVVLESADGRAYVLRVENHTLSVGSGTRSASVQLDGLQPQARYIATADGRRLVVSASAEPGP